MDNKDEVRNKPNSYMHDMYHNTFGGGGWMIIFFLNLKLVNVFLFEMANLFFISFEWPCCLE
jgi:hypothetical protein